MGNKTSYEVLCLEKTSIFSQLYLQWNWLMNIAKDNLLKLDYSTEYYWIASKI